MRFDIVNNLSVPGSLPAGFDEARAGVDLFFVITGFVMVYSSESCSKRPKAWTIFHAPHRAHRAALLGHDDHHARLRARARLWAF
jgi:peptidoglycan/LPS O-acetylase OafA/YrhL